MGSGSDANSARSKKDAAVIPADSLDFVTLGMFIIDDIEFPPPISAVHDIIGGAGTYAAVGARMFSPLALSSSIGWIVDMGYDFPDSLKALIENWETSVLMRPTPHRRTTRGWNRYGNSEQRSFRYVTPKVRLTAADLEGRLLWSKSFHMICSPVRCNELVDKVVENRRIVSSPDCPYSRPIFIWEPVPDLCTPNQLLSCISTLPMVDICSPNHTELAGFMGENGLDPETGEVSTVAIERLCDQLLAHVPLKSFTLVVRAGDKGCYIARNGGCRGHPLTQGHPGERLEKQRSGEGSRPDTYMGPLSAQVHCEVDGTMARAETDPGLKKWMPAFHQNAGPVVDPTGCGNAFLGGLGVALARGRDIEEAVVWANVAASLAIEQIGVPAMGRDDKGIETWNGILVNDRVKEYQERLSRMREERGVST